MGKPSIDYNALIDTINKGYLDWDYVYKADWTQAKETQAALDYLKNNTVQLKTTSGTQRAWVKNMQSVLNEADNIGDAVNSNTVGATVDGAVSGVTNFAKDNAGNITSTTGVVSASTGLAAAGNFVFGTVIPAVSAVAVGCALGKTIDKALYNANPDFWDSHNMSTLNPETWNEVSRALEGTPGGFVFDMLFGTSPEGNTTQAYIDEQQLAYLAWYMQTNGLFSGVNAKPEGTYNLIPSQYNISDIDVTAFKDSTTEVQYNALINFIANTPNILATSYTRSISYPTDWITFTIYHGVLTEPIQVTVRDDGYVYSSNGNEQIIESHKTFDSNGILYNYKDSAVGSSYIRGYQTTDASKLEGVTLAYANVIQGVGTQPNATTPDLSNATSIATALDLLKAQFPELWTNAVTNTVLQPDGSLKTFTYVPVPTPDASTALDPQPVTGPATQANLQVNPETAPSIKDLITNILPKLDPSENKPDIGGGNTPTVVPQTGKASSLWSIYNPTLEQVNQFGSWLWSSDFVEQLKKLFSDPMQAIIGLHKVYSPVQTSGVGTIKCGYLDSAVPSKLVSEQYTTVDCGSVDLQEYFGNVFDYPPYTEVSIYLPFIGIRQLDPSDVMRSTISVKYHIDVLTGACLAEVNVQRDAAGGTLYTFSGDAAVRYPVSSGSYMGIVSGLIGVATSIVSGNLLPALGGATRLHTNVERSGSFTGNSGAMGSKVPYLIISRPQTAMADKFENLSGYPSNTYTPLSACKGFTQVKYCHVENLNATETEKNEIERLLKEGVIL